MLLNAPSKDIENLIDKKQSKLKLPEEKSDYKLSKKLKKIYKKGIKNTWITL